MPVDVRSAVVALPDIQGLRLTSPQLRESGQRQVEAPACTCTAPDLAGGSVLELTLTGRPGSGPLLSSGPVGNLDLGGRHVSPGGCAWHNLAAPAAPWQLQQLARGCK
jgi:hypothetical protein